MAKTVVDAGGVVVEVLEYDFTMATKAELDAWVNAYKLPITSVKDPDNNQGETVTLLDHREHVYIIDLSTMKIMQVYTGSLAGIGPPSVDAAMSMMHTLLGQ
jgi:hypothetical protein